MSPVDIFNLLEAECDAANAAQDAKDRVLDEHGYGGKAPIDPSRLTGISGYIPALRLYSDELIALRNMRAELVKMERAYHDLSELGGDLRRILAIAPGSEVE